MTTHTPTGAFARRALLASVIALASFGVAFVLWRAIEILFLLVAVPIAASLIVIVQRLYIDRLAQAPAEEDAAAPLLEPQAVG
jgi:hypothetical protein